MDGPYSCAGGAFEIVAVDGEADVSDFRVTIEDGCDMFGTLSLVDPPVSLSSTSTWDTSAWLNDYVSRDCPELSRFGDDDPDWADFYMSDDGGNGQPAQGTLNMEQNGSAGGLGAGHKRQAPETPTLVGPLPKIDTIAAKKMAVERGWKVVFERNLLPRRIGPQNSQLLTQERWESLLWKKEQGAVPRKDTDYYRCQKLTAANGVLFNKSGERRVVHIGEVFEILRGLYEDAPNVQGRHMYNDASAPNKEQLWEDVMKGYKNITKDIVFDFFKARNISYQLYGPGLVEPDGGVPFLSTAKNSIIEKLRILTLTGTGLDTAGTKKLAEVLKFFPNLKLLDVSRNKICYKGASALFDQVVPQDPQAIIFLYNRGHRPYWNYCPASSCHKFQSVSDRKGEFVFNCSDNPADTQALGLGLGPSWLPLSSLQRQELLSSLPSLRQEMEKQKMELKKQKMELKEKQAQLAAMEDEVRKLLQSMQISSEELR
jgi:hypothetical protein